MGVYIKSQNLNLLVLVKLITEIKELLISMVVASLLKVLQEEINFCKINTNLQPSMGKRIKFQEVPMSTS